MRARLGIDKNKSWADWAEEEEEAAEPTKTLADAALTAAAKTAALTAAVSAAAPPAAAKTAALGFTIVKVRAARARFRELWPCNAITRRSHLPPACMCSLS